MKLDQLPKSEILRLAMERLKQMVRALGAYQVPRMPNQVTTLTQNSRELSKLNSTSRPGSSAKLAT
jgi:hypothetical protein